MGIEIWQPYDKFRLCTMYNTIPEKMAMSAVMGNLASEVDH